MKKLLSKESRAILGLSFGHFNVDLYAALLTPLYPVITTKLGINLASISIIIALGHLVSSMLQPLFGYFSDKFRHRFFMVWGLIITSFFIPLAIKANTVIAFLACLLLGMLGNALFHPQVSAMVKDFHKNHPDLAKNMGVFLGLGTIGYAIGPYLATFCVEKFGENSLLFVGLMGIISCIFLYFFIPKLPSKECYNKENFFFIIKEILKNKTCMFMTFISTVKSALSISFGTYMPFLLQNRGFSLKTTGLIVTLFFISGGIASMVSGKAEKLLGTKGVIVFSFVSILPLTLAFLYLLDKNIYISCILFIMSGFFILLSVGVIMVQAQKSVPKYTGVISGVIQGFTWGLGAMFLAPLGIIGQKYGIDKIYILMAIFTFLTGISAAKNKDI